MRKQSILIFAMMLAVICCVQPKVQSAQAQSGVNVFVHSVNVEPIPGELKYQVEMYVSVWEGDGNPINELKVTDFSVQQDAQAVNVSTAEVTTDMPSSIILVIDSSRWTSERMNEVREAANEIVGQMTSGDRIAVIDFNSKVNLAADFTDDMNTARTAINSISSSQEGACLFDGLTKSLEMIQSEPVGRRAVIVFSAGKDVLYSDIPCSKNNEDQVIQLATSGNSRIPIYAVGASKKMDILDRQRFDRFATLTGGLSIMATDFNITTFVGQDLPKILNQIKVQYRLTFETSATAGEHQFSVKASIGNSFGQGNMPIFFPDLPPLIQFNTPKENDTVGKSTDVTLLISGKTDRVASVRLELNGNVIGELSQSPYEFSADLSSVAEGVHELKAVALDTNGNAIAEQTIQLNVSGNPSSVASSSSNAQPQTASTKFRLPEMILGIKTTWALTGIAGLVLVVVAAMVVIPRKKNKKVSPSPTPEDATMDGFVISSENAVLSVLFSDDPLRIGEKIPLMNPSTTIGRYLDNNIVFDKDSPVSRHHVQIEKTGLDYILSEVVGKLSDGKVQKYPSYGTFINDTQVAHGEHVVLKSGDEIRLGTRLRLSFEAPQPNDRINSSSDVTMDGFETGEVTREGI